MARSLGLAAYRALARRGVPGDPVTDAPPRPGGELVWIHAAEPDKLPAIADLAGRLRAARAGVGVLVTAPQSMAAALLPETPGLILRPTPDEHPDSVAAFLRHWQPDLCLWAWGGLRPNLVLGCRAQGCPMMLFDADARGFDGRRDRWLPELTRRMLGAFDTVMARSPQARRRLEQLGVARSRLRLTAPLVAGGQAVACADSDLDDLGRALGGRPAWFALRTQPEELPVILSAHRQATRLSHRLLLILTPAEIAQGPDTAQACSEAGFVTVHWDAGGEPEDSTQVLVADDARDRGLFFRLAPVCFLGSSLVPGGGGCDPFEAAALGSAVLYGPKVHRYLPAYSRLAAAGAARIVNDAAALGTAVSRLIAPDQAAAMAHAGWDVISEGAELTDTLVDLAGQALDTRIGAAR